MGEFYGTSCLSHKYLRKGARKIGHPPQTYIFCLQITNDLLAMSIYSIIRSHTKKIYGFLFYTKWKLLERENCDMYISDNSNSILAFDRSVQCWKIWITICQGKQVYCSSISGPVESYKVSRNSFLCKMQIFRIILHNLQ